MTSYMLSYVNSDGAATTAGFYSGFTIPPTVDLDADLKTLGSCLNKDGTSNVNLKLVISVNLILLNG